MNNFFGLAGELIVGDKVFKFPDFYYKFDIKFDYFQEPNISKVDIKNLNINSIENIKVGQPIILSMGYQDDIGNILNGVIYGVSHEKDTLKIKCIDVTNQYLNQTVSKSYNVNTKADFILKDLFSLKGLSFDKLELEDNKVYKNGFTAVGKLKDIVQNITDDCNSQLIINNTSINILKKDTGFQTGYTLNKDTGLLNIKKIDKQNTQAQYKIEMLSNHNITAKSLLQVESSLFNGICMVIEGSHENHKTKVEVITVG